MVCVFQVSVHLVHVAEQAVIWFQLRVPQFLGILQQFAQLGLAVVINAAAHKYELTTGPTTSKCPPLRRAVRCTRQGQR